MTVVALDLFAGAGGWSVACQRLGIEEHGVEIMPEARAIRAANGMLTAYSDVWEGLSQESTPFNLPVDYDLLIASPPCQKFSMAGKGTGRSATADVLRLIDERAYLRPDDMRAFAAEHEDDGIALVLTPLAQIALDTPTYVVLEQVPPVLPIWERYAEEMRKWGYSVWTGNLQSEQWGVAQTRKRAILIARADGKEAKAPTPTHSRYYSRDPQRLDPGVKPWVSMAEALGWGGDGRMRTNQGNPRDGYYERDDDGPAPTVTGIGSRSWNRIISPQSVAGVGRAERDEGEPSMTATGNFDRARVERPAPTVTGGGAATGGAATGGAEVFGRHGRAIIEKMTEGRKINLNVDQPSPTLAGDPRIPARGWREPHQRQMENATRVTVAEAAALQSFPADFVWDVEVETPRGLKPITKTKQFLTVGNAVPPLMAEAILREVLS